MTATTIQVSVALPLMTFEVEDVFKKSDGSLDWEQIEGCTTSQNCEACGLRIWFEDYHNVLKPDEFPCPYCQKKQRHLFAGLPNLNDSAFFLPIYDHLTKRDGRRN